MAALILVGLWALAATLLWRTSVPSNLALSDLDPRRYFAAGELAATARYERFLRIDWLLAAVAGLAALAVLARRGPRLARAIGLGRIGTGIVLGMLTLTVIWFVSLPFGIAAQWWERRHGLARGGWVQWLLGPWAELLFGVAFSCLTIVVVLVLAARFRRRWWIAAAPAFTGLALLFAFVFPVLDALGAHALRKPELRAQAVELARRTGAEGTPVSVQRVGDTTSQANAMAEGIGPSRRVILWDTLLDGRFTGGEVRVVLAHEFGHIARDHVWKAVGWFGLFAVPGTFLIAAITRRRGGLREPGLLPLGFLVLALLQLAATPLSNLISRRYEAEADWIALQATRDPASARGLMERFSQTSLAQPRPPTWAYVMLETHPTLIQRIAMAEAWRSRHRPLPSG